MVESAYVRNAKLNRMAEVAAEAADLKANSSTPVSVVRRAQRDALEELSGEFESVDDVEAVEGVSERLGEYESDSGGEESDDEEE